MKKDYDPPAFYQELTPRNISGHRAMLTFRHLLEVSTETGAPNPTQEALDALLKKVQSGDLRHPRDWRVPPEVWFGARRSHA